MSNILKFYVYFFLGRLNMWMVIYILYLLNRGFSMTQVTLLGSVFWLVSVPLNLGLLQPFFTTL
ncbi:MAG: hypothetical protein HXS46_00285 [Theionarchaea archaeon]|nr:hypothetical protein [Theionarchaea archaeon]